jgi:uncharacterized protein YjbI with pentapeptide repeats
LSQAPAFENIFPSSERIFSETEMNFSHTGMEPTDFEAIIANQDSLEKLDLRHITFIERFSSGGTYRTPNDFDEQAPGMMEIHFPKLKELYFDYSWNLGSHSGHGWFGWNDSPLIFISHQTNLEVLSLNGWGFGGIHNNINGGCPQRNFRILSTLTNLKSLSLDRAFFSPDNIEQMQYTPLPALEYFSANTSVDLKGLHWDLFAPNLKTLSLVYTEINGTDVIHIANLPHLEKLYMGKTKISGGSVKKLSQLPNLEELSLAETDMTKADFSGLQTLKILDLSDCKVTIASFLSLQGLHDLEKLNLKNLNNPNIDASLIQQLKNALPNCEIQL